MFDFSEKKNRKSWLCLTPEGRIFDLRLKIEITEVVSK